jgi:hypothetical protein
MKSKLTSNFVVYLNGVRKSLSVIAEGFYFFGSVDSSICYNLSFCFITRICRERTSHCVVHTVATFSTLNIYCYLGNNGQGCRQSHSSHDIRYCHVCVSHATMPLCEISPWILRHHQEIFTWGKSCRGVNFIHLHLVPRSKNAWSYTFTPPVRLHGVVLS